MNVRNAYQILRDARMRKVYDEYGQKGLSFFTLFKNECACEWEQEEEGFEEMSQLFRTLFQECSQDLE